MSQYFRKKELYTSNLLIIPLKNLSLLIFNENIIMGATSSLFSVNSRKS
jgi:hypothetical protein